MFRVSLFVIALASCAAAPFILSARTQMKLRQNAETLANQANQRSTLQAENSRLKAQVRSTSAADALSSEELSELLRLRGEAGILRQQANILQRLRQDHSKYQTENVSLSTAADARSDAQLAQELSADTISCMKSIVAELQPALQRFAKDQQGRTLENFADLRNYFPLRDGRRMTGLYTFEFVRDGGPKPGDRLLLRELQPRGLDGKQLRVYGFSDGTAIELTFSDDSPPGKSELSWEREQLGLPPPTFEQSQ